MPASAPRASALPPEQSAEKGRRKLRHRGERRSRPMAASCASPTDAVIKISQQQNGEDRDAPDAQAARHRHRPAPVTSAERRWRKNGTTRSFDTMMASATDSTITIAVAADKPPMKAAMVKKRRIHRQRQSQHEHIAVDTARRKGEQARQRDRHHEQIDQHEIKRKQPGAPASFRPREWFSTTVT